MATFRIRKNRENPYVMLDKFSINDPGLSWKVKGLLAYLLSKPDDWIVKEHDLVAHATDGRDSVRAAIRELEAAGYLAKGARRRDGKGRLYEREYRVFERPSVDHSLKRLSDCPTLENPSLDRGNPGRLLPGRELRELEAFKAEKEAGARPRRRRKSHA